MRTAPPPVRIRSTDVPLAMEAAAVADPSVAIMLAPTHEIDEMAPAIVDVVDVVGRVSDGELAGSLAAMTDRIMAACSRVLASFVITHGNELAARTPASLKVHVQDERGHDISLWLEPSDDNAELN